ncbi:MFS transporter [Prauserella halophila]|uniref:MFS transporter n=1 Tax=Prauserella halophila TaxID=185641 RepID=A0ABP4GUV8_9PSEU|nr:MFS transporter [Prauserella halophila]MCP2236522.1 putative arabinose efflux permease, MFS family [Prauserella halophila]
MRPDSPWRQRDFRRLWAGASASQLSTFTGGAVLPLLAATALTASPWQMGLLTAADKAAFLFLGLPVGVWIDRVRRKPLMITANLLRGCLLLTVPLAWWADALTMPQLIVVALLAGAGALVFDVAHQSYLPSLVGRDRLVAANTGLHASHSVADVTGRGLGGGLVQLLGAAHAVIPVGIGYLASAAALGRIRTREPAPVSRGHRTIRAEIGDGLRFVVGRRDLRAMTLYTAVGNLAFAVLTAVQVLYLTRTLQLAPAQVGAVLAAVGFGAVSGAFTAGTWTRLFGSVRTIWLVPLLTAPAAVVVPLAQPGTGAWFVGAALAVLGHGMTVYNVGQVSYRQAICPEHLLGRMNAGIRFVAWGAAPLGALAGGALAETVGLRPTVWMFAACMLGAPTLLILSPLRSGGASPSERSGDVTAQREG